MTSIPKDPRVSELRELFRNLEAFRTVYETDGVQEVISPEGRSWSLWDLEYLYQATELLTIRQRQAITLYLVHNIRERDAAKMMGVSETNPVAMYATLGLKRLLDLMESGILERYRENNAVRQPRVDHQTYVKRLASFIKKNITVRQPGHCWTYPCRTGHSPAILVRTADGHMSLSPAVILYEVYVEPVARGFEPYHDLSRNPEFSDSCVNPWHQSFRLTQVEKRRLRTKMIQHSAAIRTRSDRVRDLGVTA